MPLPRAVLFDVDGVLVDSAEPHFLSWRRAMEELGRPLSREDFAQSFGRTSREILHQYFGDRFGAEEAAAIDARKEAHYRELVAEDFPVMPGAPELVAALRDAGFRLGLGSSGPPENVDLAARHVAPEGCFEVRVTGLDVTRGKPDPQVFLLGAQGLCLEPSRCVVVEDAVPGVQAARAAGMKVVALAASPERRPLLEGAGADRVVDSLRELSPADFAELLGD